MKHVNQESILNVLKKALEKEYDGFYEDFVNDVFDKDEFCYTRKADAHKALKEIGYENVHRLVPSQRYEPEINIITMDPKYLAEIVVLSYAEEIAQATFSEPLQGLASEKQNRKMIQEINQKLKE